MKKVTCIVIVFMSAVLFCACTYAGNGTEQSVSAKGQFKYKDMVSPNEKMVDQLVTKTYSDEELDKIANFRMSSLEEVNEAYPIECFRTFDYDFYEAVYVGQKRVVKVGFDKTGLCCYGAKYELKNTKKDFENLKIGDKLATVTELDPGGDYPFLYSNLSETSSHCTTDGYYVWIQYGISDDMQSYIVKSIMFGYI
ncbi:MAG: hypothetical protein IJB96_08390 [Lachnospira sp.]|nr:hypothetical protein [Lachnospira sp.]